MRETGLEPVRCEPHAPQTCASASSATLASATAFAATDNIIHDFLKMSIPFLNFFKKLFSRYFSFPFHILLYLCFGRWLLKIKIGFFAILLFLSLLLSHTLFSIASLLAALLHELGHLLAARICGIRMKEFSLGLFGAGLTPNGELYSYFDEIILCLGGPLSNFFFGSLCLIFLRSSSSPFLLSFVFSSFAYGILNLLPIKGFDGGRMLRAFLLFFLPLDLTEKIFSFLSFLCVFSLWSLSVYLLFRSASSLSLFIFSLSLFARIFLSEE